MRQLQDNAETRIVRTHTLGASGAHWRTTAWYNGLKICNNHMVNDNWVELVDQISSPEERKWLSVWLTAPAFHFDGIFLIPVAIELSTTDRLEGPWDSPSLCSLSDSQQAERWVLRTTWILKVANKLAKKQKRYDIIQARLAEETTMARKDQVNHTLPKTVLTCLVAKASPRKCVPNSNQRVSNRGRAWKRQRCPLWSPLA